MLQSLRLFLVVGFALAPQATAQIDPGLTGTWTSKSRKVLTGPGFYDPINDHFIEPALTGISYSFTDDGFYEMSYFRAISDPTRPSCPKGILQFQHGTFEKPSNGSLVLTPFGVDGRQLVSDPCSSKTSSYTRYIQPELFIKYEVVRDKYSNTQRLNLFAFDGAPLNPMYLAYKPPQMLPTQTLNPTGTSASGATPTSSAKAKRDVNNIEELQTPSNTNSITVKESTDADRLWWFGAGLTALGGIGYFCF